MMKLTIFILTYILVTSRATVEIFEFNILPFEPYVQSGLMFLGFAYIIYTYTKNKVFPILFLLLSLSVFAVAQQQMFLRATAAGGGPANLLLDDYPGAAAAYAVMKLDNDYAGSCIRIRRDSDNTEQDIGFSGNDIDEASINSFCSGANCFVKTWYDQSGNGNNATQTTTAKQPKIYDSSTGIIYESGITSIDLDGTDDFFTTSSFVYGNSFAVFTVMKEENSVAYGSIMTRTNASTTVGAFHVNKFISSTTMQNVFYPNGDARQFTPETTITPFDGAEHLFSQTWVSGSYYMYLDTVSENYSFSSSSGFTSSLPTYIGAQGGGGLVFGGKFKLFVIYTSDQSANRTGIETIINNYFSIY